MRISGTKGSGGDSNLLVVIGRKIGILAIVLLIGLMSWIVFDQVLRLIRPDLVYGASGIDILENSVRVPSPYVEFIGEANVLDHDEYGFRTSGVCRSGEFNIAFFGGSTGYLGDPTIAERIAQNLEKTLGIPVNVRNFSVVSSNHRQHLHLLLETRQLCEPDLVIFYGGYNEVVPPLYTDPRVNFPFNFYITRETGALVQTLIRYSPTFGLLEALGGLSGNSLSSLSEIRDRVGFGSAAWKESLRDGYQQTILLARNVVSGFTGQGCGQRSIFRFAYQPYQVPEELQEVDKEVSKFAAASSFGYDVSGALDSKRDLFLDPVHVDQLGNEIIAELLTEEIVKDSQIIKAVDVCRPKLTSSRDS